MCLCQQTTFDILCQQTFQGLENKRSVLFAYLPCVTSLQKEQYRHPVTKVLLPGDSVHMWPDRETDPQSYNGHIPLGTPKFITRVVFPPEM